MVDVLILPLPIVVFLTTWSIVLFVFCFFMRATYTAAPNTAFITMTSTLTFYADCHFFLDINPIAPLAPLIPKLAEQAMYNRCL